jgi:hypothetical protein
MIPYFFFFVLKWILSARLIFLYQLLWQDFFNSDLLWPNFDRMNWKSTFLENIYATICFGFVATVFSLVKKMSP